MTKPRILIVARGVYDIVKNNLEDFEVVKLWEIPEPKLQNLSAISSDIFGIVAAGLERINEDLLQALPELKIIVVIAAGFQAFDIDAIKRRNIILANSSGLNSGEVADHALMLMMATRINLFKQDKYVRDGSWQTLGRPKFHNSFRVEKAGIVGFGNIGLDIAKRLEPIGCEIAWWGPRDKETKYQKFATLKELASWASALFVCCPGGQETNKLIDQEILEALGENGIIINVARGTVIDEDAMINALKNGDIYGAGLDVLEIEPNDGKKWIDVPNCILTPHIAGATFQSMEDSIEVCIKNLSSYLKNGEIINRVF